MENFQLFSNVFDVSSSVSKYHYIQLQNNSEIKIKECMLESVLSFHIPKQFLDKCVAVEEDKIRIFGSLETLSPLRDHIRRNLLTFHKSCLKNLELNLVHLKNRPNGSFFKKSILKTEENLQFVPTNMHLQQIKVNSSSNESTHDNFSPSSSSSTIEYEIVTVGAATNHFLGFKSGGLISFCTNLHGLKKNCKISFNEVIAGVCGIERAITSQKSKIEEITEHYRKAKHEIDNWKSLVSRTNAVNDDDRISLERQLPSLRLAIDGFLSCCFDDFVTSAFRYLFESGRNRLSDGEYFRVTMKNGITKLDDFNEWEKTKAKIYRTLNEIDETIQSFPDLEDFFRGDDSSSEKLQQLNSTTCFLKRDIDHLYSESCAALLKKENRFFNPDFCFRKWSVFSQALSICACAVVALLYSSINDKQTFDQFSHAGILIQVESLLSTYGSENGMIEDYAVGIYSLAKVVVRCEIIQTHEEERKFLPWLEGTVDSPIIVVPFDEKTFNFLPIELQQGKEIQLTPVLFNVGINEEQSLADTFGSSLMQENINKKSFQDLKIYCRRVGFLLKPSSSNKLLSELLGNLEVAVTSKKKKNVEILRLAAQLTRLVNGARVTSCKSGKDRTAMGVTLEQCRLLSANHNMAPSFFNQALVNMRRNGTRLENTLKNVGVRRYAFSKFQLGTFPRDYRAPQGTYEKVET